MSYYAGKSSGRPWNSMGAPFLILNGLLTIGCLAIAFLALNANRNSEPTTVVIERSAPDGAHASLMDSVREVLVPIRNIKPGERLKSEMFILENRAVPGLESEVLTALEQARGKYARTLIVKNSPLLKEHIAERVSPYLITQSIPNGYRAVTISVNAESGVEGWALPGTRVDVVWTSTHRGKPLASVIVENAEVLSAGNVTRPEEVELSKVNLPKPKTITLMLTKKDAQKIQLAKRSPGALSLTLRGTGDEDMSGSELTTFDQLLLQSDFNRLNAVKGVIKIGEYSFRYQGGKLVPLEESASDIGLVHTDETENLEATSGEG